MKASDNVKKIIKEFEGCRLKAYLCPANRWTIGYGHVGFDVLPGMEITQAEADKLFDLDLSGFEHELNKLLDFGKVRGLKQGQYDALLSFAYNVGMSQLKDSTLWRKVRTDPADSTIPAEFRRWVYAGGVKLLGLERRRAAEAAMWESE